MARDVLLDYVLKVSVTEAVTPASTAYLHNVLVVAPLKSGATAGIHTCTTKAQVQAVTDSACWQLLEAGMSKVYVCAVNATADAQDFLDDTEVKFFTLLEDPTFTTPGTYTGFKGVKGWATSDEADAKDYQAISTENNTGFVEPDSTDGANMFWAFGKLLSGSTWKNQQFIPMPAVGATSSLGIAEQYFEDRVSFVLNSEQYGNRLAFFVNRGRAIVAPYIYEEFQLDLQSWSLIYLNTNQPNYTAVEASKMEDELLKKAKAKYVDTGLVSALTISILADQDNFVLSGDIQIAEPKAAWRVMANLTEGGLNG